MMYGWIITTDKLAKAGKKGDVGTLGPRGCTEALQARLEAELPADGVTPLAARLPVPEGMDRVRFRMYDDDGEHYYSGTLIMDGEAEGFEPLDDFGMPGAGCTEIRLFEHGRWATL